MSAREKTHFEKVVDYVVSDDDSELSKLKAERDYALHCLEKEIAIAHQAQTRIEWLEAQVRRRAGEAVMANDRSEALEAALREIDELSYAFPLPSCITQKVRAALNKDTEI